MALSKYLMILPLLLAASCGSATKPTIIETVPIQVSVVHPPAPAPISLQPISWKVLNYEEQVYYGLRVSDYEILALNMQEIKRYILEQQANLDFYKVALDNK